ncbi:MAG: AAA family ATPase, partial [Cyanobacteria bacterium P01_C01_bin.89]
MLLLPQYRDAEVIYSGKQTTVYRAVQQSDNKPVIVKALQNIHPHFNDLVQFRNQFVITRNLESSYIVSPVALERYDNGYLLVMADQGAISLAQYWQDRYGQQPHGDSLHGVDQNAGDSDSEDLSISPARRKLRQFLHVAIQLASALHDLGVQRVIHKDIKPANILIHPSTGRIQLIDFSIASLLPKEQKQLVNPEGIEGTLAYIAPEQTGRMNRGIDYRTDFYSLGVTFYELLTGRLPFTVTDPLELLHCHIAQSPTAPADLQDSQGRSYPPVLSAIIMKLMAKNAEERYQSALGLKHDLEVCLQSLDSAGEIAPFELGKRDIGDRFNIPEKLYGREAEVQTLLAAFERVAMPTKGDGRVELLMVAGFSGIGKTAVINEVYKPITRQQGYFIKGKFDQFNRNVPFSALVQAFRNLMAQLLGESDRTLTQWRQQILQAVGSSGQVLIDVIPELEQVIDSQPPMAELSGAAARNRFNLLFNKFVGVFATEKRPLVIFLDDLQWADAASLGLLSLLMGEPEGKHLLVLGAYRDNEVFPSHPLMLTLGELQGQGVPMATLTLPPLALDDVSRIVAETLLCEGAIAQPLATLIYQKTQGNPFFTAQFLQGLHREGHIEFNPVLGYWQCDLAQLRRLTLTDDVVAFMVARLRQLPEATQGVLKLAACIGNRFDLNTLALVSEQSPDQVATALWAALQVELIVPENQTYKVFQGDIGLGDNGTSEEVTVNYRFLHDRVQQGTYALIPEVERAATYSRIGQLLLGQFDQDDSDRPIFDIVGYLNFGRDSLEDKADRLRLAQLNHAAAAKAWASTAYDAAIAHCRIALDLLGEQCWHEEHGLTLALHNLIGSAQLSSAAYKDLQETVNIVFGHVTSPIERTPTLVAQIDSFTLQGRYPEAIQLGWGGLNDLGIAVEQDSLGALVEQEFGAIANLMEDRDVYSLLEMSTEVSSPIRVEIQLLVSLAAPTYIAGSQLYQFAALRATRRSIEHGNISESAKSYSDYGVLLGIVKGQYQQAYQFSDMAVQLAEKLDSKPYQCQAGLVLGAWNHVWARPIAGAAQVNYDSFVAGMEGGEIQYAAYNLFGSVYNLLFAGENLDRVAASLRTYMQIGDRLKNEILDAALASAQLYTQRLMAPPSTRDEDTNTLMTAAEDIIQSGDTDKVAISQGLHTALELHYACIKGSFTEALSYFRALEPLLPTFIGFTVYSYYFYYGSLALLRAGLGLAPGQDGAVWQSVADNQRQLKVWADSCPENFLHKYLLVEAECCRRRREPMAAMDLYDQAIAEAKANGYVQEEALANELAAQFYLGLGKPKFAAIYLQGAYYAYGHWGAHIKTRQLARSYPQLLVPILQERQAASESLQSLDLITRTLTTSTLTLQGSSSISFAHQFDFAAIIQAAQILSSTIELDELLEKISEIILVNAGAQKIVLLKPQDDQLQVCASACLGSQNPGEESQESNGAIDTSIDTELVTEESTVVPIRLVQYVKNSEMPVLIDQGETEIPGILEGYLLRQHPQSVLCVPLLSQGNLVAIAYLEHPTTKGLFTADRQTVIEFLCAQAAVALQNAQLYGQAQTTLTELQEAQLQLVQSEKMS